MPGAHHGLYERAGAPSGKVPYLIRFRGRSSSPWPARTAAGQARGSTVHSFAILTTAANELMAPVHGRMPAIPEAEDEKDRASPAVNGLSSGGGDLVRPAGGKG